MSKVSSKKTIKKTSKTMSEPKTKKAVKVIKKMRTASKEVVSPKIVTNKSFEPIIFVKILLVLAVGALVFLLVQKYRNLVIVGTINKTPITRWELNSKMAEKYGAQTLEEIISERLLAENLKKNNILVTQQEVNDELSKIKAQYGGDEQFKAALTQFGMTEAKAIDSIKQSLGLKKLVESQNKIEITDEKVRQYFTDNKATFEGKKLEDVFQEIKDMIYQQEIYTKSQEWYSQIRKDAVVNSYLK